MIVTILDYGFNFMTTTCVGVSPWCNAESAGLRDRCKRVQTPVTLCFRLVCLSTLIVPAMCLKGPHMGDDTIYPEIMMVRGFRWNNLSGCLQLKNKKNCLLTIDNYLLKHNGITIKYEMHIYIYIYIYGIMLFFVVFERQTNEVSRWYNLFYFTQFFSEYAFFMKWL